MILAWKQLTASLPCTIASLMTTEDSVMILSMYMHRHIELRDLGIIPVSTLLLDTDAVFNEVNLGHGHSLFSFYLRSILPACVE